MNPSPTATRRPLANSNFCQIAAVVPLKASKMLKRWVEQGVLLRDDAAGKRHTVYRKPLPDGMPETASALSLTLDNGSERYKKALQKQWHRSFLYLE